MIPAPKIMDVQDPVVPFERHTHWAGLVWEQQFEKVWIENGWTEVQNLGNFHSCTAKNGLFLSVHVDDKKMGGKKNNLKPMCDKLMKQVGVEETTLL